MRLEWQTKCDVLVVGAGLAGLRAARDCAAAGLEVVLIAKGGLCSGASFYPLTDGLGSQLPLNDADKDVFLEELLDSGAGMADRELCRLLIDEIWRETDRLGEIGIEHSFLSGRAACFAKRERVLSSWGDWPKIRANCREIFGGLGNARLMEHCDLLRLSLSDGSVCGALVCDADDRVGFIAAPNVILATGGVCGLYKHSLNTADVCGIGQSAAMDAGVDLINAEFLQFIPGLTKPKYKLLFSETSLWFCDAMVDENGRDALGPMLPEGVSVKDCLMSRSAHGPFTTADISRYFDLAIMAHVHRTGREDGLTLLYSDRLDSDPNPYVAMMRDFYLSNGIDLPRQPISILPFAHCANGGVRIDRDAQTRVGGLYAAGEAAGGVHGADRHGGVATAACLVFGARAAKSVIASGRRVVDADAVKALREAAQWFNPGSGGAAPKAIMDELKEALWAYAGVMREEKSLARMQSALRAHREGFSMAAALEAGESVRDAARAYHALRTTDAMLTAMLARRESRGGHYRTDCPARDDAAYGRRIVVRERNQAFDPLWEDGSAIEN